MKYTTLTTHIRPAGRTQLLIYGVPCVPGVPNGDFIARGISGYMKLTRSGNLLHRLVVYCGHHHHELLGTRFGQLFSFMGDVVIRITFYVGKLRLYTRVTQGGMDPLSKVKGSHEEQ